MQLSEGVRILQALADGADPDTGEVFPTDSPYQRPQVVRALMAAVRALERQQERERRGMTKRRKRFAGGSTLVCLLGN
jgi:hypothetical protein